MPEITLRFPAADVADRKALAEALAKPAPSSITWRARRL